MSGPRDSSNIPDYTHCLRKQFTHSIYSNLKAGHSINLIGEKGSGRKRLLEDVSGLARQEGLTPIVVDMNAWKHHFRGFVAHVQEQLWASGAGDQKTTPETLAVASQSTAPAQPAHLSLMLAGQLTHHRQILLLINNYDAILDNPKQRFPKSFFDDLNSLRNKAQLSLCLVTRQSHRHSKIYYQDVDGSELRDRLSWLELDILEVPRLTLSEVREELDKRIGHLPLWQQEQEQERVVTAIQDHEAALDFMEIITLSFTTELEQLPTEIRLKRCYTHYGKHYRRKKEKQVISWEKIKERTEWLANILAKVWGKKN